MASIYRRGGKKNRKGTYYIKYYDENGKRLTKRGCSDKDATEALARKLEVDVMLRKQGIIDPKADRYAEEGRKPIEEHLADFHEGMLARGVGADYAKKVCYRCNRVLGLAGVQYLGDIRPSAVQSAIGHIQAEGRSPKTCNDTLAAVKQFCRWARQDGRLAENPVEHLQGFNTAVDRRHDRRALSDDELRSLFQAATNGPTLQKCSGKERALIYKVSALTGLRKNEIASLKRESFELDDTPPTVTLEAAFSKHRREDTLPLTDELVRDLREHLAVKSEGDLAFNVPKYAYRALKKDLEAAAIPYETSQGFADFHALRHTYVTRLIKANVNPKTAQLLARHSDPRLTLGVYTHIAIIDQAAAVRSLPPLEPQSTNSNRQGERATGTDGKKSVDTSVDTRAAFSDIPCHSAAQTEGNERVGKFNEMVGLGVESQLLTLTGKVDKKVELRGIEPLTS